MNPIQQRKEIAKVCGTRNSIFYEDRSGPGSSSWYDDPDYLNDLNACHEAEKTLDAERNLISDEDGHETERDRFIYLLEQVVMPECAEDDIYYHCIHATAAQRCEAFLKCKGLWKE